MLELRYEIQPKLDAEGLNNFYIDRIDNFVSKASLCIRGECGLAITYASHIEIDKKLTKRKREIIIELFDKWFDSKKKDISDMLILQKDFEAKYNGKEVISPKGKTISIKLSDKTQAKVVMQEGLDIKYMPLNKSLEMINDFFSKKYDNIFKIDFYPSLVNIEEIAKRKKDIIVIFEKYKDYFEFIKDRKNIEAIQIKLKSCKV
jgi:hypothetical protein